MQLSFDDIQRLGGSGNSDAQYGFKTNIVLPDLDPNNSEINDLHAMTPQDLMYALQKEISKTGVIEVTNYFGSKISGNTTSLHSDDTGFQTTQVLHNDRDSTVSATRVAIIAWHANPAAPRTTPSMITDHAAFEQACREAGYDSDFVTAYLADSVTPVNERLSISIEIRDQIIAAQNMLIINWRQKPDSLFLVNTKKTLHCMGDPAADNNSKRGNLEVTFLRDGELN